MRAVVLGMISVRRRMCKVWSCCSNESILGLALMELCFWLLGFLLLY